MVISYIDQNLCIVSNGLVENTEGTRFQVGCWRRFSLSSTHRCVLFRKNESKQGMPGQLVVVVISKLLWTTRHSISHSIDGSDPATDGHGQPVQFGPSGQTKEKPCQ